MERFSCYTFAPWPDEGLLDALYSFEGHPWLFIQRAELRHHDVQTLIVEIADSSYKSGNMVSSGAGGFKPDPKAHARALRLTWESGILALESYDEFYAGPFGTHHPTKQGVPQGHLYEIVNDPDPWIQELVEESSSGVFPTSGVPVMVRGDLRAQNPSWPEPTGRFFPPTARLEDSGCHHFFFSASGGPGRATGQRGVAE